MDLLRSLHGQIIGLLGTLIVLAIGALIILHSLVLDARDRKTVKTVWGVVSLLVLIGFLWMITTTVSLNKAPRALIDRSLVEEQLETFKNRKAEKPKEETK